MMPYALRLILFAKYLARYLRYRVVGKEPPEIDVMFPWLEVALISLTIFLFILGYLCSESWF